MKILQVNKYYYRRGGADHHFFDLIKLLEKRGDTVVPFSMLDARNEPTLYSKYFVSKVDFTKPGLSRMFSVGRVFYSWEAKRKLGKLIKVEHPDVAHLHLIYHHLSPSILVTLKKAGIPTVMTIHDWKMLCPNYTLFTKGELCVRCKNKKYSQAYHYRCVHNSAWQSAVAAAEAYFHHARRYYENYIDLLIAPSNFVKDMFVDFGWPAEKLAVLPHFMPENIKRVVSSPPAPPKPRFIYVGRLSSEKGVKQLIEYWGSRKIPYILDIYGSGPQTDELVALSVKYAHASIKLHGELPRQELAGQLSDATAIIVPSVVHETFGLVAIEAFAAGLPAIVSRVGSLPSFIKASGAGAVFDWSPSGQALDEALSDVIKNRDSYSTKALEYMRKNHRPGEYYKGLEKIYKGLTEQLK